jgi:hypothetical protein
MVALVYAASARTQFAPFVVVRRFFPRAFQSDEIAAAVSARGGDSAKFGAANDAKKPRGNRGAFCLSEIVKRKFRPWQTWQRPTLPSLET